MKDLSNEIGAAGAKVSPVALVAGASVAGWGVQEWMYLATLIYVLAQLAYLCWKFWHERRDRLAFEAKMMAKDDHVGHH